jgi:hypothetical protein
VDLGELVNVLPLRQWDSPRTYTMSADAVRLRSTSVTMPSAHPAWSLNLEHAPHHSRRGGRVRKGGKRAKEAKGEGKTHLYELVR